VSFPCAAKVYSDGTWYCAVCGIRGDADEPVEDYCKKGKASGTEAATANVGRHVSDADMQSP